MYCGHCGAQITDHSKFCPICGQVTAPGGAAQGQRMSQGQPHASSVRKRDRLPIAILAGLIVLLAGVGVAGTVYMCYMRARTQNGVDDVHAVAIYAETSEDGTAYLALPDGTLIEIDDEVRRAAITPDREHVVVVLADGTLYVTDPEQSYKERIAYDAGWLYGVRNDGFYYLNENIDYSTLYRVTYEDCESLLVGENMTDYVPAYSYETPSIAYAIADGVIYSLPGTESVPERIAAYDDDISLLEVSVDGSFVVWDAIQDNEHTIMAYDSGDVTRIGQSTSNEEDAYYTAELSEDQELCVVMGHGDENMWILHRGEEAVHANLAGDAVTYYPDTEDGLIRYSGSNARYLYVRTEDPDDSDMENLYAYSMDGDRERILSDVQWSSIMNGRLVYKDVDGDLYTADLDGLSIRNETRIARDVANINMVGEYVYYIDSDSGTLYCYRLGEAEPCRVASEVCDYAVSPDGSIVFPYRIEDTDEDVHSYEMLLWTYGDEDTSRIARHIYDTSSVESGLYSSQYDCRTIDPNGFTYMRYNGETDDGDDDISLMYYDGESTRQLVDFVI